MKQNDKKQFQVINKEIIHLLHLSIFLANTFRYCYFCMIGTEDGDKQIK